MNVNPSLRPTAEQLHQLTLVYLEKGKWEGFEKITNYKETIYPAQASNSVAHSQNTGEGAANDDANIPHRGTEAHPELNLDEAIVDEEDNEVPVVRSERVTEAVGKKKKKAVADVPRKRTFSRNVYMFLGVIMLTLVVLIVREYQSKNQHEQTGNLGGIMLTEDRTTDEHRKTKKNNGHLSAEAEEKKQKSTENEVKDKDLEAKDLQSKQPSDGFEVFDEKDHGNVIPPVPPVSAEPSVIISENGIIIDDHKNGKGGENSINLNLPKEIIDLVKDAAKNATSKKKLDEWSKKMSKKYEKLGKKHAADYQRKMKSQEQRRTKGRTRVSMHSDSDDHDEKYTYSEKYPSGYLVQKHGKWGYLDRKGKEIISPRYERAWPFYEGLAAVRKHGKWGYIDKTGRTVIPHKYERPGHFSHGKAKVTYRGKRFYINRNGNCVKDCQ